MALEPMLARNFRANRIWMLDRKGVRPESKNVSNPHFINSILTCIVYKIDSINFGFNPFFVPSFLNTDISIHILTLTSLFYF